MLLPVVITAYLFSALMSFLFMKTLNDTVLRVSRWALILGLVVHLGFVFSWLLTRGSFVPSNSIDSRLILTALLAIVCVPLSLRRSTLVVNSILLPLLCVGLLGFYSISNLKVGPEVSSPWLWTHILLMVLGEALFIFSAAVSLVFLIANYQLKKGRALAWLRLIPSLPEVDLTIGETLLGGFTALSVGFLLGLFFAERLWNGAWYLDAKVVFCLLTWMFYGFVLVWRRFSKRFRGERSAVFAVIGLIAVLLLSWGVDRTTSKFHGVTPKESLENRP